MPKHSLLIALAALILLTIAQDASGPTVTFFVEH